MAPAVDVLGANTWNFNYHWGYPVPFGPNGRGDNGATAARAATRAPVRLGRPRLGRRRAVRGRAQFTADVSLPAGLRLAGATLRLDRLLFERHGRGELLRPSGLRVPRRLTLERAGAGRFTATRNDRRRRLSTTLQRRGGGRMRLTLTASAPTFRTPRVCHALPARVGMRRPKLFLETLLFINDRHRRLRVLLRHQLPPGELKAGFGRSRHHIAELRHLGSVDLDRLGRRAAPVADRVVHVRIGDCPPTGGHKIHPSIPLTGRWRGSRGSDTLDEDFGSVRSRHRTKRKC